MPDSKLISKEERHAAILERLMQFESVLVTDLAAMLNVSLVTIRKDLTELEKASKLYRSHGKAILMNPYINNRNVSEKEKLYTTEKHNIGREAAALICCDDSIILASGTTIHAFARQIKPVHKLTLLSGCQCALARRGCGDSATRRHAAPQQPVGGGAPSRALSRRGGLQQTIPRR